VCDGMAGSGSRWGQDAVQDRTKRMWDEWPPFSRGRARPAWPYPDRVRHHMSRPRGAPYRLRAMVGLCVMCQGLVDRRKRQFRLVAVLGKDKTVLGLGFGFGCVCFHFWLFASSAALSPEALTPALFGSTELG
jgi:hypothetical protein